MDKLGIEERVLMIVADNLGIDREDVLARLHEHSGALGVDSLDIVELVMELEEAFDKDLLS